MTIILYHSYYDSALSFLAKVLEEKRNLDSKKARLWEEVEEFNKQDLPIPGDILDNLSMQQEKIQLRDYGLAAQLCSCMTVEAFLNLYGVEYLGEDFYKRNLERLKPIARKVEMIIALVKREPLKEDDEILKVTQRMFNRRNRLVHPNVKVLKNLEEFNDVVVEDELNEAEKMVEDMKHFFDLIKVIDPNSESLKNFLKQSN